MNLLDQVTSLELSKKLYELGVKQESFFHWYVSKRSKYSFILESKTCNYVVDSQDTYDIYSAFTASELWELLPAAIDRNPIEILKTWFSDKHRISIANGGIKIEDDNLCNALAKMLVHLIENKLIDNNNKAEQSYTNDLCRSGMIKDWSL